MVEFVYHGEWYPLLIIDIIDWNDLRKNLCVVLISILEMLWKAEKFLLKKIYKFTPKIFLSENIVLVSLIFRRRCADFHEYTTVGKN